MYSHVLLVTQDEVSEKTMLREIRPRERPLHCK
jgi:hypothetical protein